MNPKISVIVPVYNVEKYLRRCIDSILSQTFSDFELLLIDDGSKDKSGEICDEYAAKDARVRVFYKENGGVSSARNLGLDNAKGDWITFSDSDDELLPDAFEAVCGYMHEGIDMIKTGYQILNEHNQIMETHLCDKTMVIDCKEKMFELCEKFQYFGFLWDTFIKRTIVGNVRFESSISWCEDHIFIYTLMNKVKNLALLSVYTYHYFVDTSKTVNLSSQHHGPFKILLAAKMEREAKYGLIDSNECLKRMADASYEAKVNKAVTESFHVNGFLKTILFILKESSNPRSCFKNSYKQYLKNNKLLKLLGRKFGKF